MPKYKKVVDLSKRAMKNRFTRKAKSYPVTMRLIENIKENVPNFSPTFCDTRTNDIQDDYLTIDSNFENEDITVKEKSNIKDFLINWTIKNRIKHIALNELLCFLKQETFTFLPADSRTLMQTPVERNIIEVDPGQYVYIGIVDSLNNYMKCITDLPEKIYLDFNIDGVPLSRSTNKGFWLILGRLLYNNDMKQVFVIGIYYGNQKPKNFNDFLRPLVDELNILLECYCYNDKIIKVKIRAFILDTPARAACLGIKSHNSYQGCPKCTIEGTYMNNRMVFLEEGCAKRSDEDFRRRKDEDFHNSYSILEEIKGLNMVDQFPIDYLHVLLLGVMKRLLKLWLSGDTRSLIRNSDIKKINDRLIFIGSNQPSEFQRKARPISEMGNYKGSEYRTFLKFTGPVVLYGILPTDKYNNFLNLHIATILLCHEKLCVTQNSLAEKLLKSFLEGVKELYGVEQIVYTMHSLLHLAEDVKLYGNLDQFSAFPFESFMFQVKSLLYKNNQHLSQICNRLTEISMTSQKEKHKEKSVIILKKKKYMTGSINIIYEQIIFKNFKIDRKFKNQWMLTNAHEIIKFDYAVKTPTEFKIYGFKVLRISDFFLNPIKSSKLNIFKGADVSTILEGWNVSNIAQKLFAIQLCDSTDIIFYPL